MTITQDTLAKQKVRRLKRNENHLKQRVAIQVKIIFGQENLILIQEDELTLASDIITEHLENIKQLKEDLRNRPPLPTSSEGEPT